jgi:putative ABC transport system permease protein
MNNDFTSYFVVGFWVILALLVFIALRNIFLVRLSFRNFLRRKGTTILVILGSMIGACLISGSLIMNDSFIASSNTYIDEKIGITNGIIYPLNPEKTWTLQKANEIYLKVNQDFDRFLPIYYLRVTAQNRQDSVTKNDVVVMTFDKDNARSYLNDFSNEQSDYTIGRDEVIISETAAQQLSLTPEDFVDIRVIDNISLSLKVKSIVSDNGLIGFNAPLPSRMGMAIGSVYFSPELLRSVDALAHNGVERQEIGGYNALLVSRKLDYDKTALVKGIQETLNAYEPNIVFEELNKSLRDVTMGSSNGINFGQMLLLVSSFAIIAGLVLLVNMYYMLAAERRSELGTLRALGITKFGIIKLFIFEGALYSFVSTIIGVLLGIGLAAVFLAVTKIIVNNYFADFDVATNLSLNVDISSLTYAFTGAWMVTFLTLILASIKISNIPIAAAMRDLTAAHPMKLKFGNGSFAVLAIAVGIVLVIFSFNSDGKGTIPAYYLYLGLLLSMWAAGYLSQFFISPRKIFTLVPILTFLVIFAVTQLDMFKSAWKSGPALFFINAVVMIIAFTFLCINNLSLIAKGVRFVISKISGRHSTSLVGLQYPIENRFRTSLTIVIFALVTCIIAFTSILKYQAEELVSRVDSPYDILVVDQLGRENVPALLERRKSEIAGFDRIYATSLGTIKLPQYTYNDISTFDPNAPLGIKPEDVFGDYISTIDRGFFEDTAIKLQTDLSQSELKEKIMYGSESVILGKNYGQPAGDFNLRPDISLGSKITLQFPGEISVERTVVAIVEDVKSSETISIRGQLTSVGNTGVLISDTDYQILKESRDIHLAGVYGVKLTDRDYGNEAGIVIKEILKGRNITNILVVADTIKRSTLFLNQLIALVQGFMAFGLVVGIAGVSIILVRAIYDRRQQIGMLRSIGFTKGMIKEVFMIEAFVLTVLGITIGLLTGIFSSYMFYKFLLEEVTTVKYYVPFTELMVLYGAILLASLVFSYLPARKASQLTPAEATNYVG